MNRVEAPWAKMPLSLLRDQSMTRSDLLVYSWLDYKAGKRGWFWGAQGDFAQELGIGLRSVNRAIRGLMVKGYVATRAGGMKRHNQYVYYILARTIDVPDSHPNQHHDRYATDGVLTTPQMAQTIPQTPPQREEEAKSREQEWEALCASIPIVSGVDHLNYWNTVQKVPEMSIALTRLLQKLRRYNHRLKLVPGSVGRLSTAAEILADLDLEDVSFGVTMTDIDIDNVA